jgi:hydroxypyruvate reductase/glycerate 2-kinase
MIFSAALKAADPYAAVANQADAIRRQFEEGGFARLFVIGFGKAAVPMARAVEDYIGDIIHEGIVVTKYGHGQQHGLSRIRVREAGHPVPDENGVKGGAEILEMAERADEKALVVVLISGGGSALFVSPAAGITLQEKQETTSLLLKAGAEIGELNCVRKHLSRVKGGRLAGLLYPATTVSLILSDVIGDHLDVIASGPTAPDPTTYLNAISILEKYGLMPLVATTVAKHLEEGSKGVVSETPKEGDPVFRRIDNRVISSNRLALDAAKDTAEAMGFETEILTSEISGEAREVGRWLALKVISARNQREGGNPLCLISGGETTVTVTGSGKGGRNMELALSFAMEIEGIPGITLFSAGTDGTDGPTDAAGAIVDGTIIASARGKGVGPESFLTDNDSYNFFKETGGLLITGPTGTNVMDLQILLIE